MQWPANGMEELQSTGSAQVGACTHGIKVVPLYLKALLRAEVLLIWRWSFTQEMTDTCCEDYHSTLRP